MSERSVRRGTRRFEEEGEDGLLDRRLGRRSGRAVPEDKADEVGRLYRERYAGFTAKHFHEQAFPRAPGAGPWLPLGLVDQDLLAEPRLSGPGAAARTVASGRAGR